MGWWRNITERKRAEEALRQTQAALAQLSRGHDHGELTASITHEVNQPLAAVVTMANACLRCSPARSRIWQRHGPLWSA